MAKRVLFIDDDVKRIESHIEMMRIEGYDVEIQRSSQKGLEEFRTHKDNYDIIILDIMMPRGEFTQEETKYGRITGLVLLEKLREMSKDIPIIVLTVVRDPKLMKKARELEVTEYLLKPQLPSALMEVIEKCLAK
jgi:CheY-like chemotaxis protein